MEAKGTGKLKVVGILFIVFGAIGAVIYAMALAGGGLLMSTGSSLATTAEEADMVAKGSAILMVGSAIALIWAIIQLVTGILGVKNCSVPEKAKTLLILGAILIVFSLVSNIVSIVSGGITISNVISLVGGCILPIIFMIGAKENMNA